MKTLWTAGAAISATFRLLFCCPRCGKIVWSQSRTTPQHCPCPSCGLAYCPGGERCYGKAAERADLLAPWRNL